MDHFLKTAVFAKNLPHAERLLRVLGAFGVAAGAIYFGTSPWHLWLGVASAITMVVTGLFGFCPACYLVGRKLDSTRTH